MLDNLDQFSLPRVEARVLEFWKEHHVRERILARKKKKNQKTFVFYEGPPSANGRPGIHHMIARSFKDAVLRYKMMCGFFVPRMAGWDTHGLPVEIEAEKQLGLKTKKDIEALGIGRFNAKCREVVWNYKDEWERITSRIGFWIDTTHPYVTYENDYIESVWWIVKQIAKKKLLYRGHKVVPWCTRCGTGLSSHELALGYKETKDTAVYVKFKLPKGQKIGSFHTTDNTFILSWTTTPWTLPGNVALAIGKNVSYVVIEEKGELLICGKDRVSALGLQGARKATLSGKDLIGVSYKPLFEVAPLVSEKSYKIYPADFVTTTDGTGIVHTAMMYGEDDYALGKTLGLPMHHTVNEEGKFMDIVSGYTGKYVKARATEDELISDLESRKLLFKKEDYTHEYPFCWRCNTPLLYYARTSWFIGMSILRKNLLKANNKINWIPVSIGTGRFGEWIKEAKDWAISRERYWGTPLPVWQCRECAHQEVLGGVDELKEKLVARNTYFFLRHGESDHNVDGFYGPPRDFPIYTSHLTKKGIRQVTKSAKMLAKKKIDLIVASPLARTQETAHIVQKISGARLISDPRLTELDWGGIFRNGPVKEEKKLKEDHKDFNMSHDGGESRNDVKKRVVEVIRDLEVKEEGKTILIVSHGDPLWMLKGAMEGLRDEAIQQLMYPRVGEFYPIKVKMLPLDEKGYIDLHRPYIDAATFPCARCKGVMQRVSEVMDVWFDSGSMPFAQTHYPFMTKTIAYPADFIAEGVDQTRGWFYTLLAIGVLLGKGAPYKNVISLGLLLDKQGQKMSKSKGNVVNPWELIEKHGIDVVRWNFFTLNQPGESKRFDEADLVTIQRQLLTILYNSFVFYRTYGAHVSVSQKIKSKHILDQWIMARLHETIELSTKHLDKYEIVEATRIIQGLIDDCSRWYIRRSRRRFQKSDDVRDYQSASATLRMVLETISVLLAPFMPFVSEALFQSLNKGNKSVSVHETLWPKSEKRMVNKKLCADMEKVRAYASAGLARRSEAGIKVRQPLASLTLSDSTLRGKKELLELLKDEVNVKEIMFKKGAKESVMLDTIITHALKEEGIFRELMRMIQDLRQDAHLSPRDAIALMIESEGEVNFVARKYERILKKEVNAERVTYAREEGFLAEIATTLEHQKVWIGLKKI